MWLYCCCLWWFVLWLLWYLFRFRGLLKIIRRLWNWGSYVENCFVYSGSYYLSLKIFVLNFDEDLNTKLFYKIFLKSLARIMNLTYEDLKPLRERTTSEYIPEDECTMWHNLQKLKNMQSTSVSFSHKNNICGNLQRKEWLLLYLQDGRHARHPMVSFFTEILFRKLFKNSILWMNFTGKKYWNSGKHIENTNKNSMKKINKIHSFKQSQNKKAHKNLFMKIVN